MSVGHALQDVSEPGEGLDVVELRGGDEGADGCPSDAATVRAREQMVFAPERDGPDGTLDRIVVEFDAAITEEAGEGGPARERITNGLGEGAGGRNAENALNVVVTFLLDHGIKWIPMGSRRGVAV
jgi:hypothetical protein